MQAQIGGAWGFLSRLVEDVRDMSRCTQQDRRAAGSFKERGWRLIRKCQRLRCNEIRMFQSVSATQNRMTRDVGEDHPCTARRERPVAFRASNLKCVVRFQEIVKAKHELVIG